MFKKYILYVFFLPFIAFSQKNAENGFAVLGDQIAKEMADNNKKTIAVMEFSDLQGRITDLGRFVSEELITQLYKTKKFRVIERQLLNKVLTEQKFSQNSIVDEASVKKLGKILGVNAIVTGSITELDNTIKINARLISTENAEIFAAASSDIEKTEAIRRLLDVINGEAFQTSSSKQKENSSFINLSKENRGLRFTLKSSTKQGKIISFVIEVENTNEKNIKLMYRYSSPINLLVSSESGDQWEFDKTKSTTFVQERVLTPGAKIAGKIVFVGKEDFVWTKYTLNAYYFSWTWAYTTEGGDIPIIFNDLILK